MRKVRFKITSSSDFFHGSFGLKGSHGSVTWIWLISTAVILDKNIGSRGRRKKAISSFSSLHFATGGQVRFLATLSSLPFVSSLSTFCTEIWNIELYSLTNVLYLAQWKHSHHLEQNLASIALSLLSIWLQSSVRLTVGAGVEQWGGDGELRRKQRILSPRPRSGNDSSWSDFSTLNFLSHSSNASPGHFAVKNQQQ